MANINASGNNQSITLSCVEIFKLAARQHRNNLLV